MPDYAIATPLGDWYTAEVADVVLYQDPPNPPHIDFPNVKIERVFNPEATLEIYRDGGDGFQNGGVFLNEMPPQNPSAPITAQHPPPPAPPIQFELWLVPHNVPPGNEHQTIIVPFDVGWPTGGILLWYP